MKATCYHFRNMQGAKIVGGSLGMSRAIDLEQGAAIVAGMLDVVVSPSGSVYFTHKGAKVHAYLSLDAGQTDKGRAALQAWREARAAAAAAEADSICECCKQPTTTEKQA